MKNLPLQRCTRSRGHAPTECCACPSPLQLLQVYEGPADIQIIQYVLGYMLVCDPFGTLFSRHVHRFSTSGRFKLGQTAGSLWHLELLPCDQEQEVLVQASWHCMPEGGTQICCAPGWTLQWPLLCLIILRLSMITLK